MAWLYSDWSRYALLAGPPFLTRIDDILANGSERVWNSDFHWPFSTFGETFFSLDYQTRFSGNSNTALFWHVSRIFLRTARDVSGTAISIDLLVRFARRLSREILRPVFKTLRPVFQTIRKAPFFWHVSTTSWQIPPKEMAWRLLLRRWENAERANANALCDANILVPTVYGARRPFSTETMNSCQISVDTYCQIQRPLPVSLII